MIRSIGATQSLALLIFAALPADPAASQENTTMIADGTQVSLNYTLTVGDEVIEDNQGQEPLTYTQGSGQILPALEAQLEGLTAGDEKTVNLSAAEGYGEVKQEAFQEVPLEQIPEGARKVGAMLQAQGYDGPIRVSEIRDEVAVLDFNHPLAGRELTFDITILSVEPAATDAD